MTERIKLPDPACGSICKHAMSEKCVEECAPKGEMENLEVRGELTIDRMPGYEIREDLPWKARFRLQEAYTKKAVDFIQGRKEEQNGPIFPRRPSSDFQRHHGKAPRKPTSSVPFDETNGALEVRQEHPSETIGIPEVAGKADEKSV